MTHDISDIVDNLNDEVGMITLISGHIDDKPFWAYVSIKPDRYEDFKKAEEEGEYDITDYGNILKWGNGLDPSQQDIQEMTEDYGIIPDLEEQVSMANSTVDAIKPK